MPPGAHDPQLLADFAIAYGAAREALRRPVSAPSLLPPPLRAYRLNLRHLATANTICLGVLLFVALLLAIATWQKTSLLTRKRALIHKAAVALELVQQLQTVAHERDLAFERVWPLLDHQERTLDLLHTLRALQDSRAQKDFWCVLVADSDSYARGTTLPIAITNRLGLTNMFGTTEESLLRPAFIVELCVPPQGDQALKVVSDVVADLKKNPLFSRVDSVPAAQRRALVDPKVLIPESHYAVSVELADLGWRSLLQVVRVGELSGGLSLPLRRTPSSPADDRGRITPSPRPTTSPAPKPDA